MISFNVGPSEVAADVRQYLLDAYDSGLLGRSHRSKHFTEVYQRAEVALLDRLGVPSDYRLYLLTSATECWSVLADGLLASGEGSVHLTSGSFGQRWADYTRRIHPATRQLPFGINDDPAVHIPALAGAPLICLTHNETSNGTQLPDGFIGQVRKAYPDALIAVDGTSSLAGVALPMAEADIWFASVQKCFGLPAGLAVMFVSPQAQARIQALGIHGRYHALASIHQNALNYQTVCTPNVLGVYLLMRTAEDMPPIAEGDTRVRQQAASWYEFVPKLGQWQPLVQHLPSRSQTVIAIQGESDRIAKLRRDAEAAGFLLGGGYGAWKENTFRIANFPALPISAIASLRYWLEVNA